MLFPGHFHFQFLVTCNQKLETTHSFAFRIEVSMHLLILQDLIDFFCLQWLDNYDDLCTYQICNQFLKHSLNPRPSSPLWRGGLGSIYLKHCLMNTLLCVFFHPGWAKMEMIVTTCTDGVLILLSRSRPIVSCFGSLELGCLVSYL